MAVFREVSEGEELKVIEDGEAEFSLLPTNWRDEAVDISISRGLSLDSGCIIVKDKHFKRHEGYFCANLYQYKNKVLLDWGWGDPFQSAYTITVGKKSEWKEEREILEQVCLNCNLGWIWNSYTQQYTTEKKNKEGFYRVANRVLFGFINETYKEYFKYHNEDNDAKVICIHSCVCGRPLGISFEETKNNPWGKLYLPLYK